MVYDTIIKTICVALGAKLLCSFGCTKKNRMINHVWVVNHEGASIPI